MSSQPPFIKQERSETCMLACLRMILASQGTQVSETTLVEQVSLEEGGLDPEALAALARQHGVVAAAQQLDLDAIVDLVQRQCFPIVLLDRSILDDQFSIHAVIPIRLSTHYVTVLDPLQGQRRISRRKFEQASRRVNGWAVVWKPTG